MIQYSDQKLTSNSLINKLLLTNPQLSTNCIVNQDKITSKRFIDIIRQEVSCERFTNEEAHDLLLDYYDLPRSLDKLDDESKICLIEIGYFIHELKDDKSYVVRQHLALYGYFLDEYTHDSNYKVRVKVANHYHNLNILIHDEHELVREIAKMKLKELDEE